MKKIVTLGLIHHGDQILLGKKKRGFGEGRWNGFGGKLENGETLISSLVREIQEESGLIVQEKDVEKRGEMSFHVLDSHEWSEVHMHIYYISFPGGEPRETEEMSPKWFSVDTIPYEEMWVTDTKWFPYYLSGKKFKGHATITEKNDLESVAIEEVEDFD